MNVFDAAAGLITVAAFFSFLNTYSLRLPTTIGLLLSGLLSSAVVLIFDHFFPLAYLGQNIRTAIQFIDFPELLMHGMLGLLLFAGALHVNLNDLLKKKWPILTLASAGVVLSTFLFGVGSYGLFNALGIGVSLPFSLVFGALISPTDPIVVLGIMKSFKTSKSLEIKVAGESLFNDGFGVVVFSVLLALATGESQGNSLNLLLIGEVFLRDVMGGVLLGLVGGIFVYQAMKRVDEPNLEVMLSFALVTGITFLAFQLHTSAPLACVVAGLFIGNHGRHFAMHQPTREALDLVWSFVDYVLNAILFLFLGLEVVTLTLSAKTFWAIPVLIPLLLVARLVSVAVPFCLLRLTQTFSRGAIRILTWGGLRGGISVALALSLPNFEGREAVMAGTYGIVIFSIVVQGLTIGPLIRRLSPTN